MENSSGIILYGPSGCGKTLLIETIASENNIYLISLNVAEIFSKFVDESAEKLRTVFEEAKLNAPSIIHILHIGKIAPKFDQAYSAFQRLIISQLISLIDNLSPESKVVIIGEDISYEDINQLLYSPGRLDIKINVDKPNESDRLEIFKIYLKNMPLDDDIILDELANKTEGFSGGNIMTICREAAKNAIKRHYPEILQNKQTLTENELNVIKINSDDFSKAFSDIGV
ncbi:MAG: AAA family ATPase [Promethearchaeota archaeon]|nr:MAG: AAA family ATPase [Candidatus Lokiarchaeota archaeon]